MPKIINSSSIFNPVQNGLVYFCQDSNGNFWVRSVVGNWSQIDITVGTTEELNADFQKAQVGNKIVSPADIITDNVDSKAVIVPVPPLEVAIDSSVLNIPPIVIDNASSTEIKG